MKGVLVTCNQREKLCVREAYNLLNEVKFYLIFMLLKCRKLPTQYQAQDEVLCLLSFGAQLRK